MRLVCPNCNARYEVPENVIPKHGRDVECSSCGHTWFENHPSAKAETPIQDVALEETYWEASDDDELMAALNDPLPQSTNVIPNKPKIDPELAEVLREEVERELSARQGAAIESQPDLGLEDSFAAPVAELQKAKPRHDELDELATLYKQGIKDVPSKRRELLPDIEEINSTLSSGRNRAEHRSYETKLARPEKKSRSFRGFLFGLVMVAAAVAVYVYAADISEMIPQANSTLDTYVTKIDAARVWLEQTAQNAINWLEQQAANARQG